MPIENPVNRASDLNPAWPRDTDIVREGAQHIRNMKVAMQQAQRDLTGFITLFWGAIEDIPPGWVLCDGQNGTPNMQDAVPVGAGGDFAKGATGGANKKKLTVGQLPKHGHTGTTGSGGVHSHSGSANNSGYHSHSGSANSGGNHRHPIATQAEDDRGNGVYITRSGQPRHGEKIGYTEYAGAHGHSLSINGNGTHGHSLSINNSPSHQHGFTTNDAGNGEDVDVMQKFVATYFIMKVAD